jgi:hypothetical protein
MSITNYELIDLCKFYKIPTHGVYMKDELKHIPAINGNYFINLDSSNTGRNGTHWTCLVLYDKLGNVFFDSFGCIPSLEVIDFIKRSKLKTYGYNNWIIQDIHSEFCGFFCLALFIYLKKQLKDENIITSSNNYVNIFVDNTKQNDTILKDFFRKLTTKQNKIVKTILLK